MSSAAWSQIGALEKALQRAGFPAMSPWWRTTLGRFYAQSKARTKVIRAGRRAGKSSSLCRVAVLEALFGEHAIPPGDRGVVALLSTSKDEATARLRTIEAILRAIGARFTRKGDEVELDDRPITFKVHAASVAAVSGFTSICVLCDEVAKWKDADGANPATEVLAALRPTMATQRNARMFLSSSPLGHEDAHAMAFDLGDTDAQQVDQAPTWIANPTITEAETHALEPDERVWRREYAAIPQAGSMVAFDGDAIDRAFAAKLPADVPFQPGGRVLIVDASSGRSDAWTWGVVRWMTPIIRRHKLEYRYHGAQLGYLWDYAIDPKTGREIPVEPGERHPPKLQFEVLDGIEGNFWKQTGGADIVDRLATLARTYGITHAVGDQRESLMLTAMFQGHGITYHPIAWTATSKPRAVEHVRRWMRDGQLLLPEHAGLRKELARFDEKITPSGAITFGGRGKTHDDYVALLITAAHADELSMLPSSPIGKYVRRDFTALANHIGYTRA